MDRQTAEWLKLVKGKDVVGILKDAGMPCTGIRNYIPQFKEGYSADADKVWKLLSGVSDKTTAPKRKGGRPKGSKNKPK